jgi:hypothetical protein
MTQHIYITEESLPWLIEASPEERKRLLSRLSEDSKILLLSMIASHYKSHLIPHELSPLLRESPRAAKFHNLFMEVTIGIPSKVVYDLCKKQGDSDKQTLYVAALTQMVNLGDPDAFRYLCDVATAPERQSELRYSALTGLRMMPEKKVHGIRSDGERSMRQIIRDTQNSEEMRQTARSLIEHWHRGQER